MKMKRPHIVPLSNWALEILEELKSLSTNHLIIHGRNNQVISDFYRVIRNNVNHGGKAVLSDSEETTEKLLQIIEAMEQLVRE